MIRIIGGKLRGRKLSVPDVDGLRPTSDRMRETLFNWLQFDIIGKHCLDAFSGSGALGFEAYSRGATSVTMLEQSSKVTSHLQKTINDWQLTSITLKNADAIHYLSQCNHPFDIIFLDPPFHSGLLQQSLSLIQEKQLLNQNGYVYIEYSKDELLGDVLSGWEAVKMAKAGEVRACLLNNRSPII